jgi:SAM-dependent methyltransferase
MPIADPYSTHGPRKLLSLVVPRPARTRLRSALDQVQETTFGLHETPPRTLRLSISPAWFDFKRTGRDQLEFFTELAGLRPSDRFLDIACGIGRLAIPLTHFLDDKGSSEGFDVYDRSIEWCRKNISSRHENFRFTVADVKTEVSPTATRTADDYVFPYEDGSFDFAYAGSIFTHLLPEGSTNYLEQTRRVLRPGGRLVATWNVFNKELGGLIPEAAGNPDKYWPHDFGDYRLWDKENPELNVGYDVSYVRRLYADAGLEIVEPFRPDASYSPARIPRVRSLGMHLYHSLSVIAVKRAE